MTLDLSKVVKGCKVTISGIVVETDVAGDFAIENEYGGSKFRMVLPYDSIESVDANWVDWNNLKSGMAFNFTGSSCRPEGQIVFFCFKSKGGTELFSIEGQAHPQALRSFGDRHFSRKPEKDIEV